MKTGYYFIGILLLICNAVPNVQSYTCQTPKEWLQLGDISAFYGINGLTSSNATGRKWPNGVVKYHLNSSLTEQDKKEVLQAFEEFHSKTCIRFEAVDDAVPLNQQDYVSIEVDESVCGMAHVCMQGGYQFAKFGQNCRKKNTMVHQLGHTICLTHEESDRHDGDKVSQLKKCTNPFTMSLYDVMSHHRILRLRSHSHFRAKRQIELPENQVKRIYDQSSQMHSGCISSTKKCGQQITSGLSVLDADYINAMYNCQGCYRHRWLPVKALKYPLQKRLYSFGSHDIGLGMNDHELYPCRAFFNGEVSVGKFKAHSGACYIGFSGKEYKLCDDFEVLALPDGDRSKVMDTEYLLLAAYQGYSKKAQEDLYKNAVPAGSLPWADGTGIGNGYVAFGTIPNYGKRCGDKNVWWSGGTNRKVDAIGRAWRYENFTEAFAPTCGMDLRLKEYYILGCKLKENKTDIDHSESMLMEYEGSEEKHISEMVADVEKVDFADNRSSEASVGVVKKTNHFLSGFLSGFVVFAAVVMVVGIVYSQVVKKSNVFGGGLSLFGRVSSGLERF